MCRPLYRHLADIDQHALHETQLLQVTVEVQACAANLACQCSYRCLNAESSFMVSKDAIFFNFMNSEKLF